MTPEAIEANEVGNEALDRRDFEAATEAFARAAALDERWAAPRYNLGLVYKLKRDWPNSLSWNQKAYALDPRDESTLWNMGIAASALGDWDSARRAWEGIGLTLPPGSGPWDLRLGPVPIRIAVEESPEVVWCSRLDPARARIENVPTPESGRRCGDVVLNDGAPVGFRKLGTRELAVFNELMLLERSRLGTFQVELRAPGPEEVENLLAVIRERGLSGEDWTATIRRLCQACSEGRPHDEHEEPGDWSHDRVLGVGAESEDEVRAILSAWPGEVASVRLVLA